MSDDDVLAQVMNIDIVSRGFDPRNSQTITLHDVGNVVAHELCKEYQEIGKEQSAGIILLLGETTDSVAEIRYGLNPVVKIASGNISISRGYIDGEQKGSKGVIFYNNIPPGSSFIGIRDGSRIYDLNASDRHLKFSFTNAPGASQLEMTLSSNFKIGYLPPLPDKEVDRVLWSMVAKVSGLLTPDYPAEAVGGTFHAVSHETKGPMFSLTREGDVFNVKTEFHNPKNLNFLYIGLSAQIHRYIQDLTVDGVFAEGNASGNGKIIEKKFTDTYNLVRHILAMNTL